MPTAIVAMPLRVRQATAAAASAATSFGFVYEKASVPGAENTIGGTTIAISIAAGTKRSARATSGGISTFANTAMNDSRDR